LDKEKQSSFVFWGNRIYDWMLLNFLWILTAILGLGFSVGAATGALFYSIHFGMKIDRRDILKLYGEGLKKHWRQATAIWLLFLLCLAAIILVNNFGILFFGGLTHWIVPFYGVLGLEALLITMVSIPLGVQNHLSTRGLIMTSFCLAHTHFFRSIMMLAGFFLSAFLIVRVSLIFLYLLPSVFAWWMDDNLMKIRGV